jgi:hypothetical protein
MSVVDIEDGTRPRIYDRPVMSKCGECEGNLTVLRVIGGRAGCEYWTMRCIDCGGIHLDVLELRGAAGKSEGDGPLPA